MVCESCVLFMNQTSNASMQASTASGSPVPFGIYSFYRQVELESISKNLNLIGQYSSAR